MWLSPTKHCCGDTMQWFVAMCVLSFGSINSPRVLECLMERDNAGLTSLMLFIYHDDMTVFLKHSTNT